jgi:hypothetical protein
MSIVERYAQGTPSFIELVSPDQLAAKRFYGPLLGWELVDQELGEAGAYVAAIVGGDLVAGIVAQPTPLHGRPASWSVYLSVDELDVVTARVAPAGGTVEAEPFDVAGLGRTASIQDPTGAQAHLWQAGPAIGSVRVNEPGCPIWHELTSPDLPAATAFYAEVLGVGWASLPMASGGDYTCLMVEGRPVGAAAPVQEGRAPGWEVYLAVEDADATVARAVELGGRVLQPPWEVLGVGRLAILQDPQGAILGLMENPPEPAGS